MNKRIFKINELIKEEVSQILFKEIRDDSFVTVSAVETTSDLRQATVWLRSLDESPEEWMSLLKEKERNIQTQLNKKLVLKHVPKLTYRLDHSGEYIDKLEKAFKKIKNDQK